MVTERSLPRRKPNPLDRIPGALKEDRIADPFNTEYYDDKEYLCCPLGNKLQLLIPEPLIYKFLRG